MAVSFFASPSRTVKKERPRTSAVMDSQLKERLGSLGIGFGACPHYDNVL